MYHLGHSGVDGHGDELHHAAASHGALAGALHLLDRAQLAQGGMAAWQEAHGSGSRHADEAALAGIGGCAVLGEDAVNHNGHAVGVHGDRGLGAARGGHTLRNGALARCAEYA